MSKTVTHSRRKERLPFCNKKPLGFDYYSGDAELPLGRQRATNLQVIDWQLIVQKHGTVVWQTARRLLGSDADAADCFQDTFVCALELSQRQQVRDFSALLIRLATTRAIDQLRRRSRYARTAEPLDCADVPASTAGPAQQAQNNELAEALRQSLARLPAAEAEVFCLRCLNDMSYSQIAKQLGIKTTTAGVLLYRAKAKLRRSLDLAYIRKEQVSP